MTTSTTSNNEINNQLLIEACRSGDLNTAKLLLKHHVADPNAVSSNNKTPCLLLASATNCAPLVRALLDAGADITKKMQTTGVSALHAAAATGSVDVLGVLLERLLKNTSNKSENKNSTNLLVQESLINCETLRDGLTPLHFACKGTNSKKSGQVVKKLLEAGADCFKLSSSNLSVFHFCAQSKNVEAAKAIVLHFLCGSGSTTTSSTNDKTDQENEGKRKLQALLLVKHQSNEKTPEEIAREKNDEEMLRLFQLLNNDEDLSVDEILAEHSSSPSPPPPPSSPPEDATFAGVQVKNGDENEEENDDHDNDNDDDDECQEQARSLFDPFERLPSITMSLVSNPSEKKNRKLSNAADNDENANKNDGSRLNSIDLFGASNHSVGNDLQQPLRIDLLSPEPSDHNERKPPKRSPLLMKLFGKKPEDDQDQTLKQQIHHQKEEIKNSDESEKKDHEQAEKHFSASCSSSIATSDVSFTLDDVKVDERNEEVTQKSEQSEAQEEQQDKVVVENDKQEDENQQEQDHQDDDDEVHAAETTSSSRAFVPSESTKIVIEKKEVSMDELFAPAVASDENEKQEEQERSVKNENTNPNQERNRREISDDLFPISSSPPNAASIVATNRVGDINNNDKLLDSLFSPNIEDVKNEENRIRDHQTRENQIESTANNNSLLLDEYLREQEDRRNHRTSITNEDDDGNENENENQSSDSNEDDPQPSESIPEPTPRTLGGGLLEIPIISPLPFSSTIRTRHHHPNYNNNHHHHSYLGDTIRRLPPPAATATTPTMSSPMASNVVHANNTHHQQHNFTSPRHTVLLARMPKWLALLDLPNELKIILMEQKIDEEDFYELTDDDLKSIGMEIGYRKKIMRIVNSVIC